MLARLTILGRNKMDPDVTLAKIREIMNNWDLSRAVELYELFESLDGWLSKGGYLPVEWARNDPFYMGG